MGGRVMTRRRKIALLGACGAHLGLVSASACGVDLGGVAACYGRLSGAITRYEYFAPDVAGSPWATFEVTEDGEEGERTTTEVLETGISRDADFRVRLLTTSLFDVDDEQARRLIAASLAGKMFAPAPDGEEGDAARPVLCAADDGRVPEGRAPRLGARLRAHVRPARAAREKGDAHREGGLPVRRAWIPVDRFLFAPASAAPLAVLRMGVGAVLAVQAAQLAPAILELSGDEGFFQRAVRDGLVEPGTPRAGWLVSAFSHLGVEEAPDLHGIGAVYVMALLALTAGLATRAAAAVAWFTHLLLVTAMTSAVYGVDELAGILLFYLVWVPSGESLSLDVRLGRASAEPSPSARLGLRVVQIHLCIVYLASGIHKALGHAWWNGEAVWRALMLPECNQLDFSSLARHAWAARMAGWAVLLVEIGYPVLIWPRSTRRAWVAAVVALHLGIAVFMGLHVFGAIMMVCTVAAFSVPADPGAVEEEKRSAPRAAMEGVLCGSWRCWRRSPCSPRCSAR